MGNARSLSRAHRDFESIKLHGRLDANKKYSSGKSHADDEVVDSCADSIVSCCSTTA